MTPWRSDDNIQRRIEVANGINITKPTSNGTSEPQVFKLLGEEGRHLDGSRH